jgi:hypothetical protein
MMLLLHRERNDPEQDFSGVLGESTLVGGDKTGEPVNESNTAHSAERSSKPIRCPNLPTKSPQRPSLTVLSRSKKATLHFY